MDYHDWINNMMNHAEQTVRNRVRLDRDTLINGENEDLFWEEIHYTEFEGPIQNEHEFFRNSLAIFAQASNEFRDPDQNQNINFNTNQTILYQTAWFIQNRIGQLAIERVRNEWLNTNIIP
jgi:hypothetical protein